MYVYVLCIYLYVLCWSLEVHSGQIVKKMILKIVRNFSVTGSLNTKFVQYGSCYSTKSEEPEIPVNRLKEVYSASSQPNNGVAYDKKPFKMRCEAGRTYSWCLCGRSRSQPLCDGTHRNIFWKIPLRPIRFEVKETKDYWLCNCKQTSNRPFCDGTHLREDIQEKKF